MSMVEVTIPEAIKLSDHLNKTLRGYYIGKRKVETNKTESGESLLHLFQEKDGTEIEIWSFDMLKRLLSKVPIGCLVEMMYTGKTEKDGKTIHQVKVLYDPKDKIEVSNND